MVKQGDIVKINLEPKQGHEQQGYRPYICLSYHGVSDYANIAVFAPISNTERNYPLYIPLKGTKSSGKILLDQLVTIDYNAKEYSYIETVPEKLKNELLIKVKVIFQKNEKIK